MGISKGIDLAVKDVPQKLAGPDWLVEMERREALFRQHGFDMAAGIQFALSKILPLNGRILEVGSGKGRFLTALARKVANPITSVDIDPAEQRFAIQQTAYYGVDARIQFEIRDAERLGWPAGRFDAVVTMNAMHHIPDPWRALAEMVRLLKPGGKLAVCDFSASGFYLMDRLQQAEGKTHPHPARQFPAWQSWLRAQGFKTNTWVAQHEEILLAQG
jgi:ubiquinone/menaquinone biosynthesis C-methylase UbiE